MAALVRRKYYFAHAIHPSSVWTCIGAVQSMPQVSIIYIQQDLGLADMAHLNGLVLPQANTMHSGEK